jgi:hypothetical protein
MQIRSRTFALRAALAFSAWLALLAAIPACHSTVEVKAAAPAVLASDIRVLTGEGWKGTLTYLDYTSKKPTEIRSSLLVLPVEGDPLAWDVRVGYADEPHADSGEIAKLEAGGTVFREQRVLERSQAGPGRVQIVTEARGDDDRKPATFRFVYLIEAKSCSIQKLVKFDEGGEFFERHIYRWTR